MSARDSKSPPVTICCNGADAVDRTVAAARIFGADHGLADADRARLAIIVEELVVNLVEHGAIGDDGEIMLSLDRGGDHVAIVLVDSGAAFDPATAEAPEAPPERGGGAGIALVRAWAEIVDYRNEAGRNRLELRMATAA